MGKVKNILIVSHFFYPEITPRALRITALVRELVRTGHTVTMVVPNKQIYHDHPLELKGLTLLYGDSAPTQEGAVPRRKRLRRYIPEFLVRWLLYFYNHEFFAKYDAGLERRLCTMQGTFDLLISSSYPVAVHRAVMKAFRRNAALQARVKVAEFSDPPMRGEFNRSFFPAYGLFLRRMGRFFDRFVIPVENARPCYTAYKPQEEILVIPQGFDLSSVTRQEYHPHSRPTFAYAGRFYQHTRDPRCLFEHLTAWGRDFSFTLYLIDCEPYFERMLKEYQQRLPGRITLHRALSREELIEQLSGMDFIVNQNYTYATATPIKLIDYALAGRPVFSFSSLDFDTVALDRFLAGDYSDALRLPPLEEYDIRTVAQRFVDLSD